MSSTQDSSDSWEPRCNSSGFQKCFSSDPYFQKIWFLIFYDNCQKFWLEFLHLIFSHEFRLQILCNIKLELISGNRSHQFPYKLKQQIPFLPHKHIFAILILTQTNLLEVLWIITDLTAHWIDEKHCD